jgi:hypothetical protein
MVLTRWSAQNGTLVTPNNAIIFSGSAQIPVATGETEFNVYSLIDADLGGVFALFPDRAIVAVAWQVILSLVVSNPSSKSAFGGNPIRRKLGLMTYAQGIYAIDNEPINYPLQTLSRQNFLYAEGLPEPSLNVLSPLPAPVPRDYIFSPTGLGFINPGLAVPNYGKTRALFSLETGIIGVAEISYIAAATGASTPLETNSILVSQL